MTKQVTKKDSLGTGEDSDERLTDALGRIEAVLLGMSVMLEQAKTMIENAKAARRLIELELGAEPSEE